MREDHLRQYVANMSTQASTVAESTALARPILVAIFRVICAAINFAATWIYAAAYWPHAGLIFGWLPAIAAGVLGFYGCEIVGDTLS
jgi:hypothetical protein